MSRRGRQEHWLARRETRPHEFNAYDPAQETYSADAEFSVALCGFEGRVGTWVDKHFTEDESRVDCPACRTKLAKQRLKARAADAPKLQLVADKTLKGGFRYEQGYRALLDDQWVAVVGYQERHWRVYPLCVDKVEGQPLTIVNHTTPLDKTGEATSWSFSWGLDSAALRFGTKEDALMACEDLRAKGWLKTGPELIAEREEALRRHRQWVEERQQRRVAAETRRIETLDALREILEKETLSNFQRMGVMNAIADYEARGADADD